MNMRKLHPSLVLTVLCTTALMLGATAWADIQVRNQGTWTLNGQSGTFEAVGILPPDSASPATAEVRFNQAAPPGAPFDVVINSFLCIVCSNKCFASPGDSLGQNLFDIAGGNYSLVRSYSFPGYPDCWVTASADVSFSGDSMIVEADYEGEWTADTDLNGVDEWTHTLIPNGPNSIREVGSAQLLVGAGGTIPVYWTGTYSFAGELTVPQRAEIDWEVQSWPNDTLLQLQWTGTVRSVGPLPSMSHRAAAAFCVLLVGSGALLLVRRRRRAGTTA